MNTTILQSSLPLLNLSYIQKELAPFEVIYHSVIASTNAFLLKNNQSLTNGTICLAEQQTAGRGRRGRTWQSSFAGQIIMSIYWQLPDNVAIEGLSLVIGVAVAETLRKSGINEVQLKWPNDLLLEGRKLAGILVEIAPKKTGNSNFELVIGIGINVNLGESQIDQPWSQLSDVLPNVDRSQVIVETIRNIYRHLQQFEQNGLDKNFRMQWAALDSYINEPVRILQGENVIEGINRGIDENGNIIIQKANGEVMKFNGGEVSLRLNNL